MVRETRWRSYFVIRLTDRTVFHGRIKVNGRKIRWLLFISDSVFFNKFWYDISACGTIAMILVKMLI